MQSICGQAQALGADIILLLGDYLPGVKVMTEKLPPEEWVAPLISAEGTTWGAYRSRQSRLLGRSRISKTIDA